MADVGEWRDHHDQIGTVDVDLHGCALPRALADLVPKWQWTYLDWARGIGVDD